MEQEERKRAIIKMLTEAAGPISGAAFSAQFSVTRQIIVKDIALLRAEGYPILATARGYLWQKQSPSMASCVITVCHDAADIQKELEMIVDCGGRILTTAVEHPVYGALGETLGIKSRRDIEKFLEKIQKTGCEPLLALTKGVHMHRIEAETQETLQEICKALQEAGFLLAAE